MIFADAGFFIWLIIAVVVMVAKGLGKLATPGEEEETPAPRPRPRARPANAGLPSRRSVARGVPPVVKPVTTETWQAGPNDLRTFMDRLTGMTRPTPAPPLPSPPPVVAPPPVEKPVPVTPAPEVSKPRSVWAEALRDRSNLRNIIISAEIIGPPRGM